MAEKIFIGRVRDNSKLKTVAGQPLYISKHEWSCGWYWSFGSIGNKSLYTGLNSLGIAAASEIFDSCPFSDAEWYCILDLYKQAYALQMAADIYQHGGLVTVNKDISGIIQNKERADLLNMDLIIVLDKAWELLKGNHGVTEIN